MNESEVPKHPYGDLKNGWQDAEEECEKLKDLGYSELDIYMMYPRGRVFSSDGPNNNFPPEPIMEKIKESFEAGVPMKTSSVEVAPSAPAKEEADLESERLLNEFQELFTKDPEKLIEEIQATVETAVISADSSERQAASLKIMQIMASLRAMGTPFEQSLYYSSVIAALKPWRDRNEAERQKRTAEEVKKYRSLY